MSGGRMENAGRLIGRMIDEWQTDIGQWTMDEGEMEEEFVNVV